jgi:protein gp37/transposase-like protein
MTETQQATPDTARRLTDRIKVAVEGTWQLIQEAYLTRAWSVLGYASWDEYCTREFGTSQLRLPREERQEVVASLREAGLTVRAIAAATGKSVGQTHADVRQGVQSRQENRTPGKHGVSGGNGRLGLDGKIYPQRAPSSHSSAAAESEPDLGHGESSDDEPEPPTPKRATDLYGNPAPSRPAPVMLTLRTHKSDPVEYRQPQAKSTFNQSDGEGISWASWSWNPVTGCLHGCNYCYARAIAARFTDAYPAGFTPLFHHERLDAPGNTVVPERYRDDDHRSCGVGDCPICAHRRVFVCSMADLYGRWVPDEWIKQVHESMLTSPRWEYLLLTKFPARYIGLDLPKSGWVGTSVDEQKRVRIAEDAFRQIDGVKVKWLSLEPLKEPLEFTDLSMFDWVVIGAQTETRQPDGTVPAFMPPWEWICRITAQAKEAGCKVHWKPNLFNGRPGLPLNEYPVT